MGRFSKHQRAMLVKNANVVRLTGSHIVYTDDFIIRALKLNSEGIHANTIFLEAGFDPDFFRPYYFRDRIKRWRKRTPESFLSWREKRGRSKLKKNFETLENLSVEDLRSIIRVQEELIGAIKKKKALAKKS